MNLISKFRVIVTTVCCLLIVSMFSEAGQSITTKVKTFFYIRLFKSMKQYFKKMQHYQRLKHAKNVCLMLIH